MLLTSTNVFAVKMLDMAAGDWGSGGGNGLVCFSSGDVTKAVIENKFIIKDEHLASIVSIEVYDLYEAKKRRGLSSSIPEIVEIGEEEEFYDYFDRLSKRFENHNNLMSYLVTSAKKLVPDSQILFHNGPVKNQNDLGNVTLAAKNCLIITLAAQVNYHEHYQVHIDERLFFHSAHSRQSQATLILHELFYAIGRKQYAHNDSGSTRSLLRYLITYHSSVNEGSVSNALVDLKFSDGKFEGTSNVSSRFSKSEILLSRVEAISNETKMLAGTLLDSFMFQNPIAYMLYDEALFQAKAEGWDTTDNGVYPTEARSIFQLRYIINMVLNQSSYQHPVWIAYGRQLSVVNRAFTVFVEEEIKKSKLRVNSIENNPQHITKIQLDILNVFSDVVFEAFDENNTSNVASNREKYAKLMNISDGLREEFFVKTVLDSLNSTICHSGDIVIEAARIGEQVKSERNCYGPLKLDNIIPRI